MNFKPSALLHSFVEKVENIRLPLWGVFIEFFVIFLIRDLIEVHTLNYRYDYIIHLHAIAYFLYVVSFVLLATTLFTGEKIIKVARAFSIGLLFIIPTPLIDKYIFHRTMWYDYPQPYNWTNITLSFFQSNPEVAFRGHQIEFLIIFGLLFLYIFAKSEEIHSAFKRGLFSFAAIFSIYVGVMWLSTPKISPVYEWLYNGVKFTPANPLNIDFPYYVYIFMYVTGALVFLTLAFIHSERKDIIEYFKRIKIAKPSIWKLIELSFFTILYAYLLFYYIPSAGVSISFDSMESRVNFILLSLSFISVEILYIFLIYYEHIVFGKSSEYFLVLLMISSFASLVAKPEAAPIFLSLVALSLYLYIEPSERISMGLKIGGLIFVYVFLLRVTFYPNTKISLDPVSFGIMLSLAVLIVFLKWYLERRGVGIE
jgi:hypothetical protein